MLRLLNLINATRGREAMYRQVKIQTSKGMEPMQVVAVRIDPEGNIVLSTLRQDEAHMQTAWRAGDDVR